MENRKIELFFVLQMNSIHIPIPIDLKRTPLCRNPRLDLFFVWLMKNYPHETKKIFCDDDTYDAIEESVMGNRARSHDSDTFKYGQTIPRVYYECCFSSRGPYYNKHRDKKDLLRKLINQILE
jgi:hypothetical protein